MAKYVEQDSVEAGLLFKSPSGLLVKTTGRTENIQSHHLYVHEVVIEEGVGKGRVFLLNLDAAEPMT